jgi:hypothetical protein
MTDQVEQHQPNFSKPEAYGLLAAATLGTAALAVTSPQSLAAGLGSVSTSSAVFVTPVWRFIKRINDLYIDSALYLKADWERVRGKHFGPPSHAERDVLAAHKPRFSRPAAYAAMTAFGGTVGLLAAYAPVVLVAAFGSVAVSGASFTKPVIDLVQKVNEWYVDTYNYVKGDLSKTKKIKVKPLVQDNQEIDRSIYAPVSETKKRTYSKAATYAILAGAGLLATGLVMAAPGLLVAAAGTILGSAISYTAPALKLVKRVNRVYDKAEDHIVEDLDLNLPRRDNTPKPAEEKPFHLSKPASWALAGGALLGGVALVVFAPQLITAAIGGILGAASSFTEPVLKQVGRVNDFYLDASKYIKDDWNRMLGRQPALPLPKPAQDRSTLTVTLNPEAPKVETPKPEVQAPQPRTDFNEVAAPVTKDTPAPETLRTESRTAEFNDTAAKKAAEKPVLGGNTANDNAPGDTAQPSAAVKTPKEPPPKLA